MKKHFGLALAAGSLLLAGCSSTHHSTKQWEYKVTLVPVGSEGTRPVSAERREQYLNDLAKVGWIFISADSDTFYLKRPKRQVKKGSPKSETLGQISTFDK